MADLFQSEYNMGSLRRGVQDGETLWNLLAEDGTVTVVPDPGETEIEAARKELEGMADDEPEKDPEKEAERQNKIAALSRTASFQPPPAAAEVEGEEEEDEGNGRRRQTQEKAEAKG
jgi:hypothetical protein